MGLRLWVREVRFGEREVRLRLPFKFGAAILEQTPQVFVGVHVELEDGRQAWGETAELLVPKWFDKSNSLSNAENLSQLRSALRLAAAAYCSAEQPMTAFGLAANYYQELLDAGAAQGLPPLAASFGGAELDKAVLDGVCRALGIGFQQAMRTNIPGMDFSRLAPDLNGFRSDRFLQGLHGVDEVQARHTVGMLDPLADIDRSPDQRLEDGLPETLEQVIDRYGQRYFKIKVSGDKEIDLERLEAIAAILDRKLDGYQVTLDGNEQYPGMDELLGFWEEIKSRASLDRFRAAILFIEQPVHRDLAFGCNLATVARDVPLIIDESDGTVDAFPRAQGLGYSGVSSKACKGLYKSLINAARCRVARDRGPRPLFLSAEDLTCQSGLALQQDLALISLLGIRHVERNGHHYVNGMAGAPDAEQRAFLSAHPDLYQSVGGRTCLAIESGRIRMRSLNTPGFAGSVPLDWESMSEMKDTTEGKA